MQPISKFHNNDKKSEIYETDRGFLINFYLNDKLVHKRSINATENPYVIAEDYVHNGDSSPKFLND
jgi:hypothetical protein